MKKIVVALFLAFLVCTSVFAQSPRAQAGITLEYDHYNFTDSNAGISLTDDRGNLAIGVFIDAVYLRVIVEYQRAVSGTVALTGSGSSDYPSGFSVSFVNALALAKYPIQLGTTTLWPAIGVRYSYPLSMTAFGVDALADPTTDVADFYISLGGGIDFRTGGMIVGLSVLYDYSLTPSQTTNPLYPGETRSGYDFQVALNIGFPL